MDYTTLTGDKDTDGSLKNAVNNTRLPSAVIVGMAEAWIYERLRIREMLTSTTGTLSDGSSSLPLSTFSRFRGWRDFRFIAPITCAVALKLPETVREYRAYDQNGVLVKGVPSMAYMDGSSIVFNCKADRDFTYDFLYWAAPAPLSASNTTNVLTDRGYRMLLLASLAFAYEWLDRPDLMNRYLQLAQLEVDKLNESSDMEMSALEEAVVPM